MEIPAFGYTSIFVTQHQKVCELVNTFQQKYLSEAWAGQKLDMASHKRFTNFMVMVSVSSTLLLPPLTLPSVLCTSAFRPKVKIEVSNDVTSTGTNPATAYSYFRLKVTETEPSRIWSILRPVQHTTNIIMSASNTGRMPVGSPSALEPGDSRTKLSSSSSSGGSNASARSKKKRSTSDKPKQPNASRRQRLESLEDVSQLVSKSDTDTVMETGASGGPAFRPRPLRMSLWYKLKV